MLRRLAPAVSARLAPAVSAIAQRSRSMCNLTEGVTVDMVSRVFSCKVKDDPTAHQMDCVFDAYLDAAAQAEGCAGASRLVCKASRCLTLHRPAGTLHARMPRTRTPEITVWLLGPQTGWDYKLIIKFEDVDSLKNYMSEHHEAIMEDILPQIKELAVDGEVHQQNFVYDDIE